MLTLKVESDGTTATATPTQATEVPVEVDEPHPVLEKEVPADPPSVEPVTEPSVEAAPAETPVEPEVPVV